MHHNVAELTLAFQRAALPRSAWTHVAHLTVGLAFVRRLGKARALDELRAGIRALNDAHGVANSTTSGYHETITRAYVTLLAAFPVTDGVSLDDEVRVLLASPLAAPDALLNYYSKERLMSPEARRGWIEPDRTPLTP